MRLKRGVSHAAGGAVGLSHSFQTLDILEEHIPGTGLGAAVGFFI